MRAPARPAADCATTRSLLLGLARPGQDARQRVVTFVASVFVNVGIDRNERQLTRERGGERRRIVEREAIDDFVLRNAREALGHHGVLGRAAETLLGTEVARLDDEGVAFPMTDGIAHPL